LANGVVVVMGLTNKQRVKRTKKAKSGGFFSHVSLSTARFYFVCNGVVYREDLYKNRLVKAHLTLDQFLGNPNILTRAEFKEWLKKGKVA
jgi:hypothetical protein